MSVNSSAALTARYLGAVAVLAAGIEHLQQYTFDNYSVIPTIGTLFVLNFVAAVVLAIGLIVPLGRVSRGYADATRAAAAVGGIAFALSSLAGLFVSETSGLFGFVEYGYRTAIVVAIATEVVAVVSLTVFLLATALGRGNRKEISRREAVGGVS